MVGTEVDFVRSEVAEGDVDGGTSLVGVMASLVGVCGADIGGPPAATAAAAAPAAGAKAATAEADDTAVDLSMSLPAVVDDTCAAATDDDPDADAALVDDDDDDTALCRWIDRGEP